MTNDRIEDNRINSYIEKSNAAGGLGIASLAFGFFFLIPFGIAMIAGVVGLHYAYLARKKGVVSTQSFVLGWINVIGSLAGALLFVTVIFPAALDTLA